MAQIIASRASALPKTMAKNTAFEDTFGKFVKNKRKARIIFKSFIAQANGGAVTKETIRKTIGGAEGLSMEDKRVISGKVLKGESAGSRLQYVNDAVPVAKSTANVCIAKQKPKVNMRQVMQEIMAKRQRSNANMHIGSANHCPPNNTGVSQKKPNTSSHFGHPGTTPTTQRFMRTGSNPRMAAIVKTGH